MSDVLDKPRTEKLARPAGQWRNKWYSSVAVFCCTHGRDVGPGEFFGPRTFPSKDAAETDAEPKAVRNAIKAKRQGIVVEYLGAFKVSP